MKVITGLALTMFQQCILFVIQAIDAGLQQYSYVWIIPGTYKEDWLSENIVPINFGFECLHSIGEISGFVHKQRVIAINHYPSPNPNPDATDIMVIVLRVQVC